MQTGPAGITSSQERRWQARFLLLSMPFRAARADAEDRGRFAGQAVAPEPVYGGRRLVR